ncbi:MAG: hypothetical protein ABIJ97_10005 [Bacteroidota bacterium]
MIKIIVFSHLLGYSQKDSDFSNISEMENKLSELFEIVFANDSIKFYQPDTLKIRLNNEITELFSEALSDNASFEYKFDSLKHIGVKYSDDSLLKIITWNLKFSDGSYSYYGFIQNKDNDEISTHLLIDKSEGISEPTNAILTDTNWYGALYYKIITANYSGDTFYTLLGWDGYDYLTTKKIIDVLYFSINGEPIFGKSVFKINKQKFSRMIFEYSEKSVMSLVYDENLKMIVYDYLMPSNPSYKNQYQYYGPDGSYDALYFSDGKWLHYPNIDISKLRNTGYRAGKPKKGDYQPKRIND